MRMSCNGCRVLRKGCSDSCSIRPCLQWIKCPESQANATVFLAKFYGRAGLMNLVNAGPDHLRPAIFRSLLYEACGRIVNPIYGSVGLLWSGNWQLCQNAVEAVLKGDPITQIATDAAETNNGPPLKAYDIRHVSKDENSAGSGDLNRIRNRCRFKKAATKPKEKPVWIRDEAGQNEFNRSTSHDSSLSHLSEAALIVEGESRESVSLASGEGSVLFRAEPEEGGKQQAVVAAEDGEIELELCLGFPSVSRSGGVRTKKSDGGACKMELGF